MNFVAVLFLTAELFFFPFRVVIYRILLVVCKLVLDGGAISLTAWSLSLDVQVMVGGMFVLENPWDYLVRNFFFF